MSEVSITVDELVATIRKSTLPTVLVEGTDDLTIYRWVEAKLARLKLDILPCGGRSTLLSVYQRRAEFPESHVAFVADRDMWLFTSVPDEYSNVVWTDGYSIENDVYEPSSVEELLNPKEEGEMSLVLKEVIKWFAFEVEEYRSGREAQVKYHASRVVKPDTTALCDAFCVARGYSEPSIGTIQEVADEFKLKLRGKTLFQVLVRFLSSSGRDVKYSHAATIDVALRMSNNPRLKRIMIEVENALMNPVKAYL